MTKASVCFIIYTMTDLSHEEISRKGGNSTKQRYGVDHYKEIGKLGGRPKKKPENEAKIAS